MELYQENLVYYNNSNIEDASIAITDSYFKVISSYDEFFALFNEYSLNIDIYYLFIKLENIKI